MSYSWLEIKNNLKTRDWKWLTKIICLFAIIVLIVTDQLVKLAVTKDLTEGQEYKFLPGFISLKYIINHGSAFGFFKNKFIFLSIFAILITLAGTIWLLFTKLVTRSLGLSFVLAGTLGNLIDRLCHNGGVIDFLAWKLFPPYTVFNTADIFVIIGVIIIILQMIIDPIIESYQERHGAQNNETTKAKFTTIKTSGVNKHDKFNIYRYKTITTWQIFSNSFSRVSLLTQCHSKFNCSRAGTRQ